MREESVFAVRVFVITVLCLLAAGCGSPLDDYEKIKDGMTEAEVEAILGKGEELNVEEGMKDLPGGQELIDAGMFTSTKAVTWKHESGMIMVMFREGKVVAKNHSSLVP